MVKKINAVDGDFYIMYFDKSKNISEYIYDKNKTPISIEFKSGNLEEKDCIEYANNFKEVLIKEIEVIIKENIELYKHLDISFNFSFTPARLEFSSISTRKPNLITCSAFLECNLRN